MKKEKTSLLRNGAVQSLLASLLCILLGLLIGYIALLLINPSGAGEAILTIVKNFMTYSRSTAQLKYLGNTLAKTAPLLMCSLSVLFAYKVGLFNIGAAGQYVVGAGASLYCALAWGMPWYVCMLVAIVAGALLGAASGILKAYCNVNEVISCIMLNWISLYLVNTILTGVKEPTSPYTVNISTVNPDALLPSLGLGGIVYITAGVSEWKFENGVAGFGFLALAVMIFGQWKPTRIALAAILFGFFRALGNVYSGFDVLQALNLPSSVYNMLPYIISLVVLAFTSQKSRAPKAEGIPYDKGQR